MKFLITGGCGFIGCNVAENLLQAKHQVTILDNLSRRGTEDNLAWLRTRHSFEFLKLDVCHSEAINGVFQREKFDVVIHLAGQVAVTTSVVNPRNDFEINVLGTLNMLEAIREFSPETILLYSSTNKVYGKLSDCKVEEEATRYYLPELPNGVAETQQLDFYSPYGCSKGAADQYVIDYARIFGLRTVNFRQSCIYGTRQLGVEDQGWVAWFTIAHHFNRQVTLYGTGKQVRDILFVDDLVRAYLAAVERIDKVSGTTFNVGGGTANTLSLLELLDLLRELSGRPMEHTFSDWRPGDQPVYISDIRRARELLDWQPQINVQEGVKTLFEWVKNNTEIFKQTLG